MVNIKINLLKNRKSLSEKDYQKERAYFRRAIVGFVLVVVVAVSVSLWNFVLTLKLSDIEDALQSMNKEMQGLVQANAEQIYLKSRLTLVTGFLSGRTDARESLERVLSTEIPGTHISRLKFEDDTTLGVSYVASSSADLTKLLGYYEADNSYFTQVINKGVSRANDKSYQISLLLNLPRSKK